jgi:hypothetical protein
MGLETSNAEAEDTAALMASALTSWPYFHLLGDDIDMPTSGRVPVNLDYVAGKMAESGNLAFVPILVDFLRVQLYYEGRTTFISYLAQLVVTNKVRVQRNGTTGSDGPSGWANIPR